MVGAGGGLNRALDTVDAGGDSFGGGSLLAKSCSIMVVISSNGNPSGRADGIAFWVGGGRVVIGTLGP